MTSRLPSYRHGPDCAYRWTWAEHYPAQCDCQVEAWAALLGWFGRVVG